MNATPSPYALQLNLGSMGSTGLLLLALAGVAAPAFAAATAEPTAEQAAFFESKIRPIFADNCYKCHSLENGKSKGGLTLDTRDGVLKGGEAGPAIVDRKSVV